MDTQPSENPNQASREQNSDDDDSLRTSDISTLDSARGAFFQPLDEITRRSAQMTGGPSPGSHAGETTPLPLRRQAPLSPLDESAGSSNGGPHADDTGEPPMMISRRGTTRSGSSGTDSLSASVHDLDRHLRENPAPAGTFMLSRRATTQSYLSSNAIAEESSGDEESYEKTSDGEIKLGSDGKPMRKRRGRRGNLQETFKAVEDTEPAGEEAEHDEDEDPEVLRE